MGYPSFITIIQIVPKQKLKPRVSQFDKYSKILGFIIGPVTEKKKSKNIPSMKAITKFSIASVFYATQEDQHIHSRGI